MLCHSGIMPLPSRGTDNGGYDSKRLSCHTANLLRGQVLKGPHWSDRTGRATVRKQMDALFHCSLFSSNAVFPGDCISSDLLLLRPQTCQPTDMPVHFCCPVVHVYGHCNDFSWLSYCQVNLNTVLANYLVWSTSLPTHSLLSPRDMSISLPHTGTLPMRIAVACPLCPPQHPGHSCSSLVHLS